MGVPHTQCIATLPTMPCGREKKYHSRPAPGLGEGVSPNPGPGRILPDRTKTGLKVPPDRTRTGLVCTLRTGPGFDSPHESCGYAGKHFLVAFLL